MLMSNAGVVSKAQYDEAIARIAERDTVVEDYKDRIAELEYIVEKFKRLLFGRSSEKRALNLETGAVQEMLFEGEESLASVEDEVADKKPRPRRPRGPRFRADLEREIVERTIDEKDRCCSCCGKVMPSIGVEKSEKLEFIPAKVRVLEVHRHKYACGTCKQGGVETAPVLPTAFPKSGITDDTRVHFVVQKFVDHLPYYRQSAILRRNGVELSDASIGRYALETADRLAPIVWSMRRELVSSSYLQVDETPLPVLKTERSKPGAHRAYLWTYGIPWSTIIFDYQHCRSGRHATAFLEEFRGILQNDRYAGYNELRRRDGITDVACWAHARRKFVDAELTAGRRTKPILQKITQLYAVEARAREQELTAEARSDQRQKQSKPILDDICGELTRLNVTVRPSTPIGKAIEYALGNWAALTAYVNLGEAEIDTNLLENSIRPVALGRKNYLFAGSPVGAEAAATLYSLTETCRRIGTNPYAYLKDVLRVLALTDDRTDDFFREITPVRWTAARSS